MKKLLLLAIIITSIVYGQDIRLTPSTVTYSSGFDRPLLEENKNMTLITQEEISKKQYDNVESILRDTPNVNIQYTQFGPIITLRGSGERSMSRVKVMVDGMPITPLEEAMGTIPINSIPVSAIDRIEVIQGGGATLYGSGTTGGVVNIITKSDATSDYVNVDMKGGSYYNKDINVGVGQNLSENFYVNFSGQYMNREGYRAGDELEAKSFTGGFDYKIDEKNRLKFQTSYFKDDGRTSTEISKLLLKEDRRAKGENIDYDSERRSFSLDYEHEVNDSWKLYANIFDSKYERRFIQDDTRDYMMQVAGMPFPITLKDLHSTLDGKFTETSRGVKLKSKYEYEDGVLVTGYEYTHTNLKRQSLVQTQRFKFADAQIGVPNFLTSIALGDMSGEVKNDARLDIDKDTHAVYALNNYELTNELSLITGIRYEYSKYSGDRDNSTKLYGYDVNQGLGNFIFPNAQNGVGVRDLGSDSSNLDKSYDNFAGELGLNYRYSDTGSVYTRYERGFITPLPGQLTNKVKMSDTTGKTFNKYVPSNVKPEKIDSIEVGVRDMIDDTYVSATLFFSQTNDEITTLDQNANNPAVKLWRFVNIGQTRRVGGEFYLQKYLDKWTLTSGVNYVNAKISKVDGDEWLKKGDRVPMVPEWKIVLGADYALTDKINLGALYTYNGGYEKRELETYEKTKVSGFGVTDIYATYNVNDSFSLKLGVNNIFNELYNYYESSTMAIPAPERNYYVGVSLKF